MDIRKEYKAKISGLSSEISDAIAKIPSLPRVHHCPGEESQESIAQHLEWLMSTRESYRKSLAKYERARRDAIAHLS
jgi:predicted component of type VI protein secretion system